ncbi:MAG: C39 family peptidase [Anaerolineales bacterium]
MPKVLLDVPLKLQKNDGDCLAASAAMALAYLNQAIRYNRLLDLLDIKFYGAPASNILRLATLGLDVTYSKTSTRGLKILLHQQHPIIVFLRTSELPYWSYATNHALVVVGYDVRHIYVNDPVFEKAPLKVSQGDFELAWLERDYAYAVIARS